METSAALTHLTKSIFNANKNYEIYNFIEKLIELYDKLSYGDRYNPDTPNAINVLTTIGSLNCMGKKFNIVDLQVDLKEMYDILCEVAHPNFGGYRINMIETGKSTIQILDENRPFFIFRLFTCRICNDN